MLKKGDIAPSFILKDQDNNDVSLSDYVGKKVIVWFYPKANTPGWIIEGNGFRDEFQHFVDNDIQILGVSADPVSKQKKFSDKRAFPFPLLSDESKNMLKSYHAWGPKKFMGKEYKGIYRITYLISEDSKIEHVYDNVKTRSHASDILNTL